MTIKPQANTDKVVINYTDEDGKAQTITVSKGANGKWSATGVPPGKGISVDENTGTVKLPPDAVKDQSDVNATASNTGSGKTASDKVTSDVDGGGQQPGPDNPLLEKGQGAEQGGVTIKPQANTDKVVINYTDEDGKAHTITVSKGANGKWSVTGVPPNKGISVDENTGTVKLPPNAVKDGSEVKAAASNTGSTHTAHSNIITDNDADAFDVSISGSTEVKEGETANYTVKLSGKATKDVTVTVTLTHKGTDDSDFAQPPVSKSVTIKAGETEAKFSLDIAKDGKFEGTEKYDLTLSNPQGAKLGQSTVETKITDTDPPPAPDVKAGSEQGSVVVTPAPGVDKLTVDYKGEDGRNHKVVVSKDATTGEWKGTDIPDGVDVDAKTGKVTIAARAVADKSEVKAVASAGNLNSDTGVGTAGEDAVNNLNGKSSSNAITADKVGMTGEYYGYNDDSIDRLVQNNPKIAANVRWHADDKKSGVKMPGHPANNLYDLDFTEKMINGRNGSQFTGGEKVQSAAKGTPDARFTVTDINYGGAKAVQSGLANNERAAPGEKISAKSALRNFLDVNGANDADSARAEAGAPHKGTSGLGYTTDAAVRIAGKAYFSEGTYDFKFALDNGATVRIDGKDIYKDYSISEGNTLGKHPNGIHLSEGVHTVEIVYLEEGAVSTLHMQYKAHGAPDSSYKTMGLNNTLMLKPEAELDLNQLQDVHNTGTADNPAWHVRTGATLDGGEGKDNITGSDGRDFIYGHDGNDALTGGKGRDTFIYNTKAGNGHDVIKDFKIGEDKITLTDLLDTKSINPKTPGWKGISEIQNAQWDDSAHKLSFDTTDGAGKTYHNSITFEGMTHSYNSVDDFLRENGNGII
ncbi:immunoglobulin-like domain-containing protein [Cardiobacterium valvarum]|uniref:immunoglobulin-like domain-containing protein n=1 Tax=Cardiobacterium valvarum TaxID=194702 RepID=UPI0035E56083